MCDGKGCSAKNFLNARCEMRGARCEMRLFGQFGNASIISEWKENKVLIANSTYRVGRACRTIFQSL